ncbi:MAG: hypothetical protein JWP48_183 [Actinoallomurus sp.]|jgi:hypothetical protein|nr:hypothetical protein [Actinoallomurus sp.]
MSGEGVHRAGGPGEPDQPTTRHYLLSLFFSLQEDVRSLVICLLQVSALVVLLLGIVIVMPHNPFSMYSPYGGFPGKGEVAAPPTRSPTATPTPSPSPTATPSVPPETGASEAAALDGLFDQAEQDRTLVSAAVVHIQNCDASLDDAVTQLDQAAQSRSDLADQAERQDVSQVSGGDEVVRLFAAALRDSAQADQEFSAWGSDVSGSCFAGSESSDEHAQNGISLSDQAGEEKKQLATAWNTIADTYGLPHRKASKL